MFNSKDIILKDKSKIIKTNKYFKLFNIKSYYRTEKYIFFIDNQKNFNFIILKKKKNILKRNFLKFKEMEKNYLIDQCTEQYGGLEFDEYYHNQMKKIENNEFDNYFEQYDDFDFIIENFKEFEDWIKIQTTYFLIYIKKLNFKVKIKFYCCSVDFIHFNNFIYLNCCNYNYYLNNTFEKIYLNKKYQLCKLYESNKFICAYYYDHHNGEFITYKLIDNKKFKLINMKILNNNDIISKFKEYNNFIVIDVNKHYKYILNKNLEKIYFQKKKLSKDIKIEIEYCENILIIYDYEYLFFDLKTFRKINLFKLNINDKITKYENFPRFIWIEINNNINKLFNKNYKKLKLKGINSNINNLKNIYIDYQFIILKIKNNYMFYDLRAFKRIRFIELKENDIINDYTIDNNIIKLTINDNQHYLYLFNESNLILLSNKQIKKIKKYINYLKILSNNEVIIFNIKLLKKIKFKGLNDNEIITNFKEYKNFLYFEINNSYNLLYNKFSLKRIIFRNLDKNSRFKISEKENYFILYLVSEDEYNERNYEIKSKNINFLVF